MKLTNIAISENFYVSGSMDCNVIIWKLNPKIPQVPKSIISKNKSYIKCLEINEQADLCVSCSKSGEIVTASLFKGMFLRKILTDYGIPSNVTVFNSGNICISFIQNEKFLIVVYDQNLNQITMRSFETEVRCWCNIESPTGNEYLFVSLKNSEFAILKVSDLSEVWKFECDVIVTRLTIIQEPLSIIIGTIDGKVLMLPFQ